MNALKNHTINLEELLLHQAEERSYKGEISVFRSSVRQELRPLFENNPTSVNAYSCILILSGSALLQLGKDEYLITRNMLCVFQPMHLVNLHGMTDDFQCITLCMHKTFIDRLPAVHFQRRMINTIQMNRIPFILLTEKDATVLYDCFEDTEQQLARTEHRYQLEMIQQSVTRFFLELDNIIGEKISGGELNDLKLPQHAEILKEFTHLLLLHYKKEHTVPFYAQRMNTTAQRLTAIVKEQTGKTVNDFIYETLYCEACNLLISSGLSIQQITAELNFSDQAAFSKFFKKRAGVSPFEYRKIAKD